MQFKFPTFLVEEKKVRGIGAWHTGSTAHAHCTLLECRAKTNHLVVSRVLRTMSLLCLHQCGCAGFGRFKIVSLPCTCDLAQEKKDKEKDKEAPLPAPKRDVRFDRALLLLQVRAVAPSGVEGWRVEGLMGGGFEGWRGGGEEG